MFIKFIFLLLVLSVVVEFKVVFGCVLFFFNGRNGEDFDCLVFFLKGKEVDGVILLVLSDFLIVDSEFLVDSGGVNWFWDGLLIGDVIFLVVVVFVVLVVFLIGRCFNSLVDDVFFLFVFFIEFFKFMFIFGVVCV